MNNYFEAVLQAARETKNESFLNWLVNALTNEQMDLLHRAAVIYAEQRNYTESELATQYLFMKKFKIILACLLTLLAVNVGIPIMIRTIHLNDERDRYVIYQTFWN